MTEPFQLKITDGGLWMDFREFIRLVSELQRFGVDAEVLGQDDKSAVFKLKEAFRE